MLKTLLYSNPPRTVANAADLIDQALGAAMHAMRTNIHTTRALSGVGTCLDFPLIAD